MAIFHLQSSSREQLIRFSGQLNIKKKRKSENLTQLADIEINGRKCS